MRKAMLRASAALAIVIIAPVIGAAPSEAECLAADVIVYRTNQADEPVVTDGQCLVPTPFTLRWRVFVEPWIGSTVTGVPSGAMVELWVPVP